MTERSRASVIPRRTRAKPQTRAGVLRPATVLSGGCYAERPGNYRRAEPELARPPRNAHRRKGSRSSSGRGCPGSSITSRSTSSGTSRSTHRLYIRTCSVSPSRRWEKLARAIPWIDCHRTEPSSPSRPAMRRGAPGPRRHPGDDRKGSAGDRGKRAMPARPARCPAAFAQSLVALRPRILQAASRPAGDPPAGARATDTPG